MSAMPAVAIVSPEESAALGEVVHPANAELFDPSRPSDEVRDIAEIRGGTSIVKLSMSERLLAELAAEHSAMPYDLAKEGDKDAIAKLRKFRMKCSAGRTAVKESGLALRRPLKAFGEMVQKAEGEVRESIQAIEKVGDDILTAFDAKVKADAERKAKEAADKAAELSAKVASIGANVPLLTGRPSAEIAAELERVNAIDPSVGEFGEKAGEAIAARLRTVQALQQMHTNMLALEQQQREMAEAQERQRLEMERQRAELAAQQATQRAIDDLARAPTTMVGKTAAEMRALLEKVSEVDTLDELFSGRKAEATLVHGKAIEQLEAMIAAADAAEALAAQQAAQAAELEAERVRQAEVQAELDRQTAAANARKQRVQDRIDAIKAMPAEVAGAAPEAIAARLRELERYDNPDLYEGRETEATKALAETRAELERLHLTAIQREADKAEAQRLADEEEARRTQEQRDELERQRVARAKAKAIADAASQMHALLCAWAAGQGDAEATALLLSTIEGAGQ